MVARGLRPGARRDTRPGCGRAGQREGESGMSAAAAVPPGLPGTSASGAAKVAAIFSGVFVPVLGALVALLVVTWGWSGAPGGHLPWPAVQWALTSPVAALLVAALCLLVEGPSLVLLSLWPLRL